MTRTGHTVKMTSSRALLTMMQWQYNASLFLPEASISPAPILPRLASVDVTSLIKFILVECPTMSGHIDPFHVNVGILATQPNTIASQPAAFYVPNLVMTIQIVLLSNVLVPILLDPIMYFIGAALPTTLNPR